MVAAYKAAIKKDYLCSNFKGPLPETDIDILTSTYIWKPQATHLQFIFSLISPWVQWMKSAASTSLLGSHSARERREPSGSRFQTEILASSKHPLRRFLSCESVAEHSLWRKRDGWNKVLTSFSFIVLLSGVSKTHRWRCHVGFTWGLYNNWTIL